MERRVGESFQTRPTLSACSSAERCRWSWSSHAPTD